MPAAVLHSGFADLPQEALFDDALLRSAVRTDGSLVVFNWIKPVPSAPPHHDHPFDQLALILEGTLEFDLAGESYVVAPGELLYIPAGVPHTARVLGDTTVLNVDIFAPPRADYLHLAAHQST